MKISLLFGLESKVIKIFYINLKGRASDSINFIHSKSQRLNANHKCTYMWNKPRKKCKRIKSIIIIIKSKVPHDQNKDFISFH